MNMKTPSAQEDDRLLPSGAVIIHCCEQIFYDTRRPREERLQAVAYRMPDGRVHFPTKNYPLEVR